VTPAWTFPCNPDKSPIPERGFRDAFQGMEWRKAPLVGAPTGAKNGFSVLDIDPKGFGWYAEKFGAIPTTRRHETQRGVHLLFRHAPGLRGSIERVAPGVDVRAEGNYVIWWPREGLAVDDWPIADWPEWLMEEARGKDAGFKAYPSSIIGGGGVVGGGRGVGVEDATEALRKLDPCAWRGEHDEWFALLMGAKAAGVGCDDFVEWSIGDPEYADHAEIIRVKWNSIEPRHAGAFFKALSQHGITLLNNNTAGVRPKTRHPSSSRPQANHWLGRVKGLRASLRRDQCEGSLFSYACLYAEILYEEDRASPDALATAQTLLEGDCPKLIAEIGIAEVRRTIANAFRHVEEKVLGERE
jgi:Bifunctional DNA primase/polymerase, N-terminal/Primase C terminal 2 (PriCT-2)